MKNKNKKVAINAELRKESQTFNGWLKYEVTIKNEDGTLEKVPAYGKDLQDALSRVVHDYRVKVLEEKVIKKVPETGWAVAWFMGQALMTSLIYYNANDDHIGYYIVGSIALYALATLSIFNWFTLKNRSKK